jgi:hypothetical protein
MGFGTLKPPRITRWTMQTTMSPEVAGAAVQTFPRVSSASPRLRERVWVFNVDKNRPLTEARGHGENPVRYCP